MTFEELQKELQSPQITYQLHHILDDNPDTSYNKLNENLHTIMHKPFPIKYVKFNKYKEKKNQLNKRINFISS